MAEPATQDLTPTVRSVADELGTEPVTARQLTEAILRRHDDYGGDRGIAWPRDLRAVPVQQWLDDARAIFSREAHPALHGRAAILGAGLADPPAGRAMTRAGLFYALSFELTPALWDGLTPEGRERLDAIPILAASAGFALGSEELGAPIGALAYSASGNQIAAGRGAGWVVLKRANRQEAGSGGAPDPVDRLVFAPDGRLAVGNEHGARLVTVGVEEDTGMEWSGMTLALGVAGDRPLAATSDLLLMHLDDGITTQLGEGRPAMIAAFADDAPELARADVSGTIDVWNVLTEEHVERLEGGHSPVTALAMRSDAALAAHAEGEIWLHKENGAVQLGFMRAPVTAARFSPRGQRVVAAGHGASLWDPRDERHIADLYHEGVVGVVAFSPSGEFLATGDDHGVVRVFAAATGALVAGFGRAGPVTALAWSPDGEQLAAGTETGSFTQQAASLEPPRRARLASYSPDDVDAAGRLAERLEIDDDIDAFAALLAARAVSPPLSIGLFGDWGSGKTFFMRRLRARVDQLSEDARESGEPPRDVAWHMRIAQVEFNAWHYAEGNLWASLVQHILDNLSVSPDEPADRVERRKAEVVRQITAQRGVTEAARARLAATQASLDETAHRRDELAEELAAIEAEDPLARSSPMPDVIKEVREATDQVALPGEPAMGEGPTIAELAGAVDNARVVLEHGHRAAAPLLYARDRGRRFWLLVAVLVGAPALALIAGLLVPDVVRSLTAAATGIAAALAGAAAWMRRQFEWTRARLGDLDSAAQALEAPAREQRQEQARELRRLQAEHDAASRTAAAEEQRLLELKSTLAAATPSRMLAQLVADRVESDDYRRHLGVLALVRRDFEAMSEFLRLQAEEIDKLEPAGEEPDDDGEDLRVGRIVLYVDDLDRCEPKQVVAVLQAVHLLLAFPLFVVVVGVDMRWVERSLALQHEHLLASGDAAPRDYLEKIFQIPFWIEPLDAESSRRMLRGLVGDRAVAPAARSGAAPAPDAAAQADVPADETNGAGTLPAANEATPEHTPGVLPASRELAPESLEIEPLELECMNELALLLGRSPRALKRFVNTYRLIKVRAPDAAALLRDDPPIAPYRALLFLLALCTGTPHAAAAFLDAAIESTPGRVADLVSGNGDERARIDAWLADQASAPWRDLDVVDLRPWAAEVVRFTFHWHAQSRYS